MADAGQVLLIRHGETHGYHGDVGLTEVGERQARAKGAQLAAELGDTPVQLRHAPTARSTATAVTLRSALIEAGTPVGTAQPDPHFDSMQFLLGDRAVESTNVGPARAALGEDERPPDWAGEYDRFSGDGNPSRGAGPIDRWLVATTLHMEPPQVAAYRLWAGVRALLPAVQRGQTVLVVSHSGPMRAFVTAALGRDCGEPDNLEHVSVRPSGDTGAMVGFREHLLRVDLPAQAPPWLDPAYLDGQRAGRPITG